MQLYLRTDLRPHLDTEQCVGSVLKNLQSEIDVGKGCNVKINKVMLECRLVPFKHFLSSGLHGRVTSKWKEKSGVRGRKGQGRKRRGVAVE